MHQKLTFAAALGLSAITLVPPFFTPGLWSPDEPRYAAVAWHMRATGDLLVPHLNGELYPEKPPAFFWLAALGDLAAPGYGSRIVEALAAFALALLMASFFPRGSSERLLAPVLFGSTLLAMMAGKFGIIDSLYVLCMAAAILCGRSALGSAQPLLPWVGFYAALAAGCLVKGPVIMFFAIVAVAGSIGEAPRAAPRSRHAAAHLLGALIFAALILAWLVPACRAGGSEYRGALLGQIAGRVSGERETHLQPWPYYFAAVWHSFVPWTLVLIGAIRDAARRGRESRWLLLWLALGFAILTIAASKRERYLLFLAPAATIALARHFAAGRFDLLDTFLQRATALLCGLASLLLAGGGIVAAVYVARGSEAASGPLGEFLAALRPWQLWIALPIAVVLTGSGALVAWRSARRCGPGFVRGVALFAAGASLAADLVIAPALDPVKTGRAFVAEVASFDRAGGEIILYDNDYDGRFTMALGKIRLPVLASPDEVAAALKAERPVAIVLGRRKAPPDRELPPPFNEGAVLASGFLGGRTMHLVGNAAAARAIRR